MIRIDKNTFDISENEKRLGYYGDNCVNSLTFEIIESSADCEYFLYISFPNGSINCIPLEIISENNVRWTIHSEQLFSSGRIYMQIKAVNSDGEIWHSPKASAMVYGAIEEEENASSYTPTLFEKVEAAAALIGESKNAFITRAEALEIIDELLLPLCRRLDGE